MTHATRLLALVLALAVANPATADETADRQAAQQARDVFARYQKAGPQSQHYMTFVAELVKCGPPAIPVLVEKLRKGPTPSRLLAGDLLKLMVEPGNVDAATRSALEDALGDEEDSVREFSIQALYRIGGLEKAKLARHVLESDPNPGIRRVMAAALNGEMRNNSGPIRKALEKFDPATVNSARLGQVAPDFALADTAGKVIRLSQFRGQKTVVLLFLVEDD